MRRSSSEVHVVQLEPARRWLEHLVAVSDPGWSSGALRLVTTTIVLGIDSSVFPEYCRWIPDGR